MMAITSRERAFRSVCGEFATGITVLATALPNGGVHGMTANAFLSLSLRPLLIGVSVQETSYSHTLLSTRDRVPFSVSVLNRHQHSLAQQFAGHGPCADYTVWQPSDTGIPVIRGSLAWLQCHVDQRITTGDHIFIVGAVGDFGYAGDGSGPLLFYGGSYYHGIDEPGDSVDWSLLEQ